MNAVAMYRSQSVINTQNMREISTDMLSEFVSFIDRTERTTKTYITNLRQFFAWMKYKAISMPIRQDIIAYRDWLTADHIAISFAPDTEAGWEYRIDSAGQTVSVSCKANTIKIYLQSVKQFFAWTEANGIYPNIAANIHAPKTSSSHKKDSLTPADVLSIENSITEKAALRTEAAAEFSKDTDGRIQRSTEQGKRLYAMYLLAVNAGLRTIEISRANIKDLETKGGKTCLYIWGKGRSEADQKKPIAPEVKEAIDDYIASRTDAKTGNSPLFVSTGNRSGGKRIATTTISTMLKRAMQDAGYNSERLTAHSLRHTTGQNVMQLTGNNIYATQQYLRHANPATTEIYLDNENAEQNDSIATQLYNRYHNGESKESKLSQLQILLSGMTPDQIAKITGIAEAIAR